MRSTKPEHCNTYFAGAI